MATRVGVKEFRDNFTTIAREAKGPVIVTSHDKVIGYYTPATKAPVDTAEWLSTVEAHSAAMRAEAQARGIDVAARLKELGIEDDELFDDPWVQGNPGKPAPESRR